MSAEVLARSLLEISVSIEKSIKTEFFLQYMLRKCPLTFLAKQDNKTLFI